MRRSISLVIVFSLLAAGYTALGVYGYHDYWTPIHVDNKTKKIEKTKITLDLDNLDRQVRALYQTESVEDTIRVLKHKLGELSGKKKEKYEPNFIYYLGQGYSRMGKSKTARSYFERYLKLKPKTDRKPELLFDIAQTHSDPDRRRSYLRRAARLSPRGEIARKVAREYGTTLGPDPSPAENLFHLSLKFRHRTSPGSKKRQALLEKLQKASDRVFRTGEPRLDAKTYTVERGDTLSEIAAKHDVGIGWVNYTNGRSLPVRGGPDIATRLRPGDQLTIFPAPLSIEVFIADTRLYLFYDDQYFVKSYPVGVGKGGNDKTPTGTYKITSRTTKPRWTHPETGKVLPYGHEENIIGTRWISLSLSGYGIHGIDPKLNDTIGTKSSMGCIRMKNEKAEELYDLLPALRSSLPDSHVPTVRIKE